MIEYTIDDETREMVEAALNCMMVVADAQINEDAADALVLIADTLADRFGVEKIDQEVHDGVDENGDPVTVIREVRRQPKFKLSDYWRDDDDEDDEPKGPAVSE